MHVECEYAECQYLRNISRDLYYSCFYDHLICNSPKYFALIKGTFSKRVRFALHQNIPLFKVWLLNCIHSLVAKIMALRSWLSCQLALLYLNTVSWGAFHSKSCSFQMHFKEIGICSLNRWLNMYFSTLVTIQIINMLKHPSKGVF